MGDPIWLDTNVVQFALQGDPAVNEQLASYRRQGRQLLIPPGVKDEVLLYQKEPDRTRMVNGMKALRIEVDTSHLRLDYNKRYAYWDMKNQNVSREDRRILSAIKASAEVRGINNPEMITGEGPTKAMRSQAHHWGVKSVPAAQSPPGYQARVIIADDYPPDGGGPISRFFKDRPVLTKLGVIGAGIAAQKISDEMMEAVERHFESVLADARKEFNALYPDPINLKAQANLDRFKSAYEAALSKVTAPTRAKVVEAVALAFTRDRDIDKAKRYFDDQISKVQSAADGSTIGFSKAAEEYIDAMVAFYKRLTQLQSSRDLTGIAADIAKRGDVLTSIGNKFKTEFWRFAPTFAVIPFADLLWMRVLNASDVFFRLGGSASGLASEIKAYSDAYALMQKQLDEQLLKVSDELARYSP